MLFDKISELREKFKSFFINKKKLKALENYSSVSPFKYKNSLNLVKKCMEDGFLNEKGAEFLNSILDEYEVNFLDWAYRTKWLKGKMSEMGANYAVPMSAQLTIFDLEKKSATPHVPVEALIQNYKNKAMRI